MTSSQNAVGLIETRGIVALMAGVEAMMKTAEVETISIERIGSGYFSAAIKGSIAAVRQALDSGVAAVRQYGELRSAQLYPRPDQVSVGLLDNDTRAVLAGGEASCRYSSGSTWVIRGVLRRHGGRIVEENRLRSPVTGSVCLSLTRGARTSTAPAEVRTCRGLMATVTHDQAAATGVTLVGEPGDVGIHLGLQRLGQHPAGALTDDLIDQRPGRRRLVGPVAVGRGRGRTGRELR